MVGDAGCVGEFPAGRPPHVWRRLDPKGALPVRILIVSQYFHPENFRVNKLATTLREGGHAVTVLTGRPNYPSGRIYPGYGWLRPASENWQGISIIRVPMFPRGRGGGWRLALNYASFALFATLIGIPRVGGRFDACIAFCPSPLTIAIPAVMLRILRRTPVAMWLQDLWPESVLTVTKSRGRLPRSMLNWMVGWLYRHVDQIWIQSPGYTESVVARGGDAARIAYVPNWAEDLYDCERWADVAGDPLPANSIVFAGNLGRAQGLDTVIEAATITREYDSPPHWVLLGDGVLRDWLHAEVLRRSLRAHVTLLPQRPADEMPRIFKSATALLVTLADEVGQLQTIPSKIQSCLASGRPVIAAVSGAAARLLQEAQCGEVCAPQDAAGLAQASRRIIALSPEERTLLGRNGHAYYRAHFTQSQVMQRIVNLLEELTAPAKST